MEFAIRAQRGKPRPKDETKADEKKEEKSKRRKEK
jgi:hypothetical protein